MTSTATQEVREQKKKPRDIYQEVTDRIVELLEQGTAPWHKPWGSSALAQNYESKNVYTGINMVLFNLVYADPEPYYLTFNQVKKLGGKVKKGSKARQVVYFNVLHKDADGKSINEEQAKAKRNAKEEVKVIPYIKTYNVFNIADIENIDFDIPAQVLRPENERLEQCEAILQNMPNAPKFKPTKEQRRAYYVPSLDEIHLPMLERFERSEAYYNTFYHEAIHATGHASRLAREGIATKTDYGTDIYAFEEIIAELGASFLCGITKINREVIIENNAAYVASWVRRLKDDKKLIFRAAAKAKQAVEYILDKPISPKQVMT